MESLSVDVDGCAWREEIMFPRYSKHLFVKSCGFGDEDDRAVEAERFVLWECKHFHGTLLALRPV